MPKVTINNTKGLFQEAGSGLTVSSNAQLTGRTTLSNVVLNSETVTDAGAISVSVPLSLMVSAAGATVPTLANGSYVGQLKYLIMTDATGTSQTATPVTTSGTWASLAFTVVGQSATLVWTAGGWAILGRQSGATAGATAVAGLPVVA